MAFEHWNKLSNEERSAIAEQAAEKQDAAGRHICYWCGAPIGPGGYAFTSNARDPREICKGECKNRRFFDNPE